MAILGTLIKTLIDVKDIITSEPDVHKDQCDTLNRLLSTAKDTEFGKYYGFEAILECENIAAEFAKRVPYFDYHEIHDVWWHRYHEGEENITWPGKPDYYALSSGTTGKESKRIPVSEEMIEAIKNAGMAQISALTNFNLPAGFFEKEIMMLGSSTRLTEKDGHLEGEISGISAGNIPFWFKGYYKPGEEIAGIDDWDAKVQKIAENAKEWDIGAISGIPSWVELMLQKVIAYHGVNTIHDVWPNLLVYTSGGVAFEPYRKSFNALLAFPVTVIDTYLASEGFIACQQRPESMAMKLLTGNGIYFEFIPFKPEYVREDGSVDPKAPVVGLKGVEPDKEYILLISTVSGLWRYVIGDTIAFTDTERAEIRITGRTRFFLNVVGSQLSVNKMNDAVQHLEKYFDVEIPEFTVSAIRLDGEFYHSWYLGTQAEGLDEERLAEELDAVLKNANKNYGVARSKSLKGVKVSVVKPEVFHGWSEHRKKKGGQVKTQRVMDEDTFAEWEEFVVKTVAAR